MRAGAPPDPPDGPRTITGAPSGWPVAGDWDGDGRDTLGVVDLATGIVHLRNRLVDRDPLVDLWGAESVYPSGHPGAYPVVGDFDGDGKDTLGFYDLDTRVFAYRDALDAAAPERRIDIEAPAGSWVPVAGRWGPDEASGEQPPFDWPTAAPAAAGFDPARLSAAYAAADGIDGLHSLLIVRGGKLVAERYYDGFDAAIGNNIKSVSKSVLSALYGIALADGTLAGTDQLAATWLPEYFNAERDPRLGRITLGHLLTMTAGFDWDDDAQFADLKAAADWTRFVTERPITAEPGTRFDYSTGLTIAGAVLLERAVGADARDFAAARLFGPLQIAPTRWDSDRQGHAMGGAEIWLRPRDMARFGELFLRGGAIDGRRIVAADWVRRSTGTSVALDAPYGYGGWWWQRRFAGHATFFAWGYGGQFIFIVPDLDLVVVTTSAWWRPRAEGTDEAVFGLLESHILPAVGPVMAGR